MKADMVAARARMTELAEEAEKSENKKESDPLSLSLFITLKPRVE